MRYLLGIETLKVQRGVTAAFLKGPLIQGRPRRAELTQTQCRSSEGNTGFNIDCRRALGDYPCAEQQ